MTAFAGFMLMPHICLCTSWLEVFLIAGFYFFLYEQIFLVAGDVFYQIRTSFFFLSSNEQNNGQSCRLSPFLRKKLSWLYATVECYRSNEFLRNLAKFIWRYHIHIIMKGFTSEGAHGWTLHLQSFHIHWNWGTKDTRTDLQLYNTFFSQLYVNSKVQFIAHNLFNKFQLVSEVNKRKKSLDWRSFVVTQK